MKLEAPTARRLVLPILLAAPVAAQDPTQDPLFGDAPASQEAPPLGGPEPVPEEVEPTPPLAPDERSPFYVAAGFGFSDLGYDEADLAADLLAESGIAADVSSLDDSDSGVKFYAGYRVHERIALELGFVDLGDVRSEFEFTGPPGSEAAVEDAVRAVHPVLGSGVTAGVRGVVLDGIDLDVSAKAGAFFWEAENDVSFDFNGVPLDFVDDKSGTDLFYGVGVHYDVADRWALQLEYERYEIEDETADHVALSARYEI